MVDVLMIVFICLIAVVLVASNIYILFYFGAEDESKSCLVQVSRVIAVKLIQIFIFSNLFLNYK